MPQSCSRVATKTTLRNVRIATTAWPDGFNTGIYHEDSTCECWEIGIPDYTNIPAATTAPGVTYLDFFETGPGSRPSKAQDW